MIRFFSVCFHTIITLITLLNLQKVLCFYNVPSYYGHFSKIYFQKSELRSGTLTYFQYHFEVDINYQNNTVYYVNKKRHCIQQFSLVNNRRKVLAGRCGESGDRVGDIDIMQMNSPSSIVFYQQSTEAQLSEKLMRIVLVNNQSCIPSVDSCKLSDDYSGGIGINNIKAYPQIQLFPQNSLNIERWLYVSDTQNHCIKRINIDRHTSEVVGGVCGISGFIDGQKGFNKLNRPTNIGINKLGTVYFYDEGNQYMRKILKNGEIQTLKNGACKYFFNTRRIKNYQLKSILCYDNWVETQTKSEQQHILGPSQLKICIQHSSKCS